MFGPDDKDPKDDDEDDSELTDAEMGYIDHDFAYPAQEQPDTDFPEENMDEEDTPFGTGD